MPPGSDVYAKATFIGRDDDSYALAVRALPLLEDRPKPRLLDLGCGTGGIAIAAASACGSLEAVAIDMSPDNVRLAHQAAAQHGLADRLEAVVGDYMEWRASPFDVIISNGVLHLIAGTDGALAAKLAGDLRPGGTLIVTMPVRSPGNWVRTLLRRIWSITPTSFDAAVVRIAGWLYPHFSPAALAARIPYLRVRPHRLYDPRLEQVLAAAGLIKIIDEPWPSASIAKFTHRLLGWRRTLSGAG